MNAGLAPASGGTQQHAGDAAHVTPQADAGTPSYGSNGAARSGLTTRLPAGPFMHANFHSIETIDSQGPSGTSSNVDRE